MDELESSYQGAVSVIRKLAISKIVSGYLEESIMGRKLIGRSSSTQVLMLLALLTVTGLGLSVASAQTSSQSPTLRPANSATATSGSGEYYFEFRSRQSWDYGHTFVVFGRVGGATPQE